MKKDKTNYYLSQLIVICKGFFSPSEIILIKEEGLVHAQRTLFSGVKLSGKRSPPVEETRLEKDFVSPKVINEYS